jgi:hypothetical protein
MRKTIIHYWKTGLFKRTLCNAGSGGGVYQDILSTSEEKSKVTCKKCLKLLNKKEE